MNQTKNCHWWYCCTEMELGQNMNATERQESLQVKAFEQQERSRSRNDVMIRRLKNRERQRRYRARKRLEAEMNSTYVSDAVAMEKDGNDYNFVTLVHRKRNWKKDARRAHACSDQTPSTAAVSSVASNIESQTLFSEPGVTTEAQQPRASHPENGLSLRNSETQKPNLGRRNWKAEARKMTN
ncbi:hypothetical protein K2173_002785 [Erythroxylum novogranatense]|uniref:BZIP domain-containing protein n=1 Tax=Erythroxylum novogranatense TaxID=1862640 RepID=A0AAV8SQZ8_9ROSI|nr:hypothetical protein K2173_002785 [Erythroxylum novogranatense]